MTAKKLSKYTWNTEEVLTSAAMTAIGTTINNLIDDVAGMTPGETPGTDPDNPTPTTKASVQWITEEEFEALLAADALEEGILYIVTDEDGNILYMYLNGQKLNYVTPTHSGEVPSGKITEDQWNQLTDEEKKSKIWVVVASDGVTVIGIGTEGILVRIPVPASGKVVKLTQEQYDALSPKEATTLYCIEQNGVIVKAYLGEQEMTLNSTNSAVIRSEITSMFSQGIIWDEETKTIKGIKGSMIDVTEPGQLYASTAFQDAVTGSIRTAGLVTQSDLEENFATLYANKVDKDGKIAKAAEVTAKITKEGTSEIQINADDIVLGSDTVNFGAKVITALEAALAVNKISLTEQGQPTSVDISPKGILIHPTQDKTAISLNADGSGFLASGNISWDSAGVVTIGNYAKQSDVDSKVGKDELSNLVLQVNGLAKVTDIEAVNGRIDNIEVPDTATIKQAVIGDLDLDTKLASKANLTDFESLVQKVGDTASLVVAGTTIMEKLTALDGTVTNLDVPDTATIKNAVIEDIEAGNVTITGDLHYGRAIGNVQEISSSGTIGSTSYFVMFTGPTTADASAYPVLQFPSDAVTGQTIFLDCGTRCFKLAAPSSGRLDYYYRDVDGTNNTVRSHAVYNGDTVDAFEAGWNGTVEFIYTGSKWQQLIHNIALS